MDATDLSRAGRLWVALLVSALMTLLLIACAWEGATATPRGHSHEGTLAPKESGAPESPGIERASEIAGRDFLEQQAEALRPVYREEVYQFDLAPRYQISATVDLAAATVTGHLHVLYTNRSDEALHELTFRLLANAEAIYGRGHLSVTKVTVGDAKVQPITGQDGVVMRVRLPELLEEGESELIEADFETQLPTQIAPGYGILAQTGDVTRLSGWYPMVAPHQESWQTPDVPVVGDALLGETSLYEVLISIPAGHEVVSTGTVISATADEREIVWRIVSGPARDFSLAISDGFEQRTVDVKGVTISFYVLSDGVGNTSADNALVMMEDAFGVYQDRFGPYPWTEFDVVETEISIGGYEFSGMVFVDQALRLRGSLADYRYIVAHETAHQWWYGLVGNNQITEPWLDESLATYSAVIYLEEAYGEETAAGLIGYWRGQYGGRAAGEPPVDSSALDFAGWGPYRETVYIHGALFLDALREEIGDARFFHLLQAHLSTNRFGWVTTERLLNLAQDMADSDLGLLIDRWFE